jgi:hypothetical protein
MTTLRERVLNVSQIQLSSTGDYSVFTINVTLPILSSGGTPTTGAYDSGYGATYG